MGEPMIRYQAWKGKNLAMANVGIYCRGWTDTSRDWLKALDAGRWAPDVRDEVDRMIRAAFREQQACGDLKGNGRDTVGARRVALALLFSGANTESEDAFRVALAELTLKLGLEPIR
jgi:hypothetical protein